ANIHGQTRAMHELASSFYLAKNALSLFLDTMRAFVDNPFSKASQEYEVHLRNFNSLAQETEAQLKLTHNAIQGIATEEQLAGMTELAKTLQHIESSNYHGAEAFQILEASNQAAMAGLADLFTVADAGTSILKAYGYEASKITDILNINAKAVQYGKVTMDQLNSVVGTAISLAPEAKVGYDEVGAAIATITAQGVSASIAATEVNALMKGIFKPSVEGAKLATSLGIELSAQNLANKGLYGMMKDIMDKTKHFGDDRAAVIAKMLGDMREIRGILKLATDDGELYNEMLGHMRDGEDAVEKQKKEQIKTFKHYKDALGDMTESMKIEVGALINEELLPFISVLNDILKLFNALPEPIKRTTESIILLGVGAVGVGIALFTINFGLNAVIATLALSAVAANRLKFALMGIAKYGLAMFIAGGFFVAFHEWVKDSNNELLKMADLIQKIQDFLDLKKAENQLRKDEERNNKTRHDNLVTIGELENKSNKTLEEKIKLLKAYVDLRSKIVKGSPAQGSTPEFAEMFNRYESEKYKEKTKTYDEKIAPLKKEIALLEKEKKIKGDLVALSAEEWQEKLDNAEKAKGQLERFQEDLDKSLDSRRKAELKKRRKDFADMKKGLQDIIDTESKPLKELQKIKPEDLLESEKRKITKYLESIKDAKEKQKLIPEALRKELARINSEWNKKEDDEADRRGTEFWNRITKEVADVEEARDKEGTAYYEM
ncbi:MAG: phage tail tape measure protein, partial [Nanoarchaeota archaeon]